ncbi:MAG: CinA family nicotinamide mononucleotide deamidase-related protein [Bacteroidota bacterium]
MDLNKHIAATIITIGDELLIGQTIDTNSAWIASSLNKIGITIKRRVAVGDEWDAIWQSLEDAGKLAKIILITGGLGPTSDDITKPLLCKFFGGKLVTNQGALDNVVDIFTKKLNRPLLERNVKQAEVPDNCIVIQNKRGTAPGMWFEKNNVIYVSMPGVPHEMKGMMDDYVIPELIKKFNVHPVQHRTLLTAGIGESFLAEKLTDFEANLPANIKLAYLPNYGMVRLRLTDLQSASDLSRIDEYFQLLKLKVQDFMVIDDDVSMQEVIARKLLETGRSIAVAESCTGGHISQLFTQMAGSSQYFLGSVVSYSNEMKQDALKVPEQIIQEYGAVSSQTVEAMAEGVRKLSNADLGLATSGIMGPAGGTDAKPVGFVWVGFSSKEKTASTSFQFRFDRKRNIELTAISALDFLRKNMG